jgi:imidazolonepropionase-like amidohydrolase
MSGPPSARLALAQTVALSLTVGGLCAEFQSPQALAPDPPASPASVPLVIEDVSVIGMDADGVTDHRTVVVSAGRVQAIGDRTTPHPAGAVVIPGRGRYLLPALIDMHAHVRAADLSAYPTAGITTVRNMWGWPELPALIARVERGEIRGPRIISASQGLDGEPVQWPATRLVRNPAQAVAAVREQGQAGWRYLKVYTSLSRESYAAILDEAAALGIPVIGHVPVAVPIEEALARGQRSIEHLTGYDRRVSRSGRAGTSSWADADPAGYRALAEATQRAGAWNCPTLAIYVALSRQHSPAEQRAIVEQRRRFVRELHRAGALLLAGSDAGIGVVRPGQSLHDELAELVASGLTPYEALRAATVDAGRFLQVEQLGTVAAGAPADLLLVAGNPLDDLTRLRRFDGLIHRGAWIPAGAEPAPTSGDASAPGVIQVGGTYSTAVTLGDNTCGSVTVQPLPTTVQHSAGATTFSLAHGPLTYQGTLETTGAFTTAPRSVSGGGETSTLRIVGQFTVTGFTATVTVDVERPGSPLPCRYLVAWVGTKQGDPNIIP